MKLLTWVLALAVSQTAMAGADQVSEEFPNSGINEEALDVYSVNELNDTDAPEYIVMRIDTKTGKRSVIHSDKAVASCNLDDKDFVDLEYSDLVENGMTSLLIRRPFESWHHDRRRGFGYNHRYRFDSPYRGYYGRYYEPGPRGRFGYRGDRYWRYRPYESRSTGELLFRLFKRIID